MDESYTCWKVELENSQGVKITKSILVDPLAESASPGEPAFITPPSGAPAYYGFPLIPETARDGFTLGSITDYQEKDSPEGCTIGDAFVEGPDGTRAGIFWELGSKPIFTMVQEPDETRWGVYYFTILRSVNTIEDLVRSFELMLPAIKEIYARTHDAPGEAA
jgi:hypothetical protein